MVPLVLRLSKPLMTWPLLESSWRALFNGTISIINFLCSSPVCPGEWQPIITNISF
jgi:hypothetical protein